MLDIHTHLYFPDFDLDRDETVRRAKEAGVDFMISVGTDPEDNAKAIGIAEAYDGVSASVGLHPHFFNRPDIDEARIAEEAGRLEMLAGHPKVVAIGECGLDYFSREPGHPITDEQKSRQKEGLFVQMGIAMKLGLPLILHTRPSHGSMDAYEDMFDILLGESLKAESYKLKAVLHCYQGDTGITRKFLGLPNVYFSFAGNVTYPVKKALEGTKDDIREAVKLVPSDRLFLETDCPFLAPQGKRGGRNEPAFVRLTAGAVAAIRAVPEEEIDRQVGQNALRVFGRK